MKTNLRTLFKELHSGDSIKASDIKDVGLYPVYGGNGLRGYTNTFNADGNYIIIGRQGAYCGNVRYNSGKAYLSEHAILGIPKDDVNHVFLSCYLNSLGLYRYQGQSAQPGLAVGTIETIDVDVPDYDTQNKIGNWVSDIDRKIALNRKENATLEAMAKQLYDYWFVQFDFPDTNGRPYKSSGGKMVWNATLKREIPAGWEVKKLGELISSNRGISYNTATISGGGIPMLNLATFGIDGEYKDSGLKTYNSDYSEGKILRPLDLVMCNTQQTAIDFSKDIIGKAFLVPDIFDSPVVSSHHVTTIRPHYENHKFFLKYLFNTYYFHAYAASCSSGTNIMGLDFSGIERYTTEVPEERIIDLFANIIKDIKAKESSVLREIKTLSSMKSFILPLLMNGQASVMA